MSTGEHTPDQHRSTEQETTPESHSGSRRGFRVEARNNYREPLEVGGVIYTKEWRMVPFQEGACGVPAGPGYHLPELAPFRCYTYQAAQALRWWLHAELEAKLLSGGLCFETRLVQYEISYSRSCKRLSEHAHIHGDDRSNCIPDWGKKS